MMLSQFPPQGTVYVVWVIEQRLQEGPDGEVSGFYYVISLGWG